MHDTCTIVSSRILREKPWGLGAMVQLSDKKNESEVDSFCVNEDELPTASES